MQSNSSPSPLTPSELSALVELEKKATRAPWTDAGNKLGADGHGIAEVEFDEDADRALVVALRNAAPRLFAELLALREEKQKLDALLVMERTQARAALADTDHTARCKFRQHFDSEPCSCGKSVIERARALASFDAAALRMSDPGAFVPAPPAQEAPAG